VLLGFPNNFNPILEYLKMLFDFDLLSFKEQHGFIFVQA